MKIHESGWYKVHDLLTVFSPGFLPCAAVQMWNLRSLLSWWEQFPWAQKTKPILAFAAKLESCHPRNLCLHWYQPTWVSTYLGSQASDSSSPEVPNYFQTSFQRAHVFLATGPCLRQKYGESRRMYGLPLANHTSQWKITYFTARSSEFFPLKIQFLVDVPLPSLIAGGY